MAASSPLNTLSYTALRNARLLSLFPHALAHSLAILIRHTLPTYESIDRAELPLAANERLQYTYPALSQGSTVTERIRHVL